jgi:putative FmdB family regulatory protein
MPTYDYQCDACNHTFEEFQSFSEKPLKKCPQCKKSKLRRLLGTGAAIIFKGAGFYQTDYRSESYKNAAKADEAKPAESKPAESQPAESGKKADTTPAADTSPKSATAKPESPKSAGKSAKSNG